MYTTEIAPVQQQEQRSIALYRQNEGAHSLPAKKINPLVFSKSPKEVNKLKAAKKEFKNTGLSGWNKRNRPGNN